MSEQMLHEEIFNKAIYKILREETIVARFYCGKEMRKKKVFTCLSILGALKASMSCFIKDEIFDEALHQAKNHPDITRFDKDDDKESFSDLISSFDPCNLKEHKEYMKREIQKYLKYYDEIYVIMSWSTAAFFSLLEEFDDDRIVAIKQWALKEVAFI